MAKYRNNPRAVAALVRETEVHKDCYIDEEVFALEMAHLFANTWVYVGHASQVPQAGDFFSTTVGDQPVVMVRHTDGSIKVLYAVIGPASPSWRFTTSARPPVTTPSTASTARPRLPAPLTPSGS